MSTQTNDIQVQHKETETESSTPKYPAVKPKVDVFEGDEGLLLVADLPGVSREDLAIHLHGDELVIEGFRGSNDEEDGVVTEFRPTSFKRSFTLRDKVDADHVTAKLTDGVLQLTLPKAPELKPRQIAINAA